MFREKQESGHSWSIDTLHFLSFTSSLWVTQSSDSLKCTPRQLWVLQAAGFWVLSSCSHTSHKYRSGQALGPVIILTILDIVGHPWLRFSILDYITCPWLLYPSLLHVCFHFLKTFFRMWSVGMVGMDWGWTWGSHRSSPTLKILWLYDRWAYSLFSFFKLRKCIIAVSHYMDVSEKFIGPDIFLESCIAFGNLLVGTGIQQACSEQASWRMHREQSNAVMSIFIHIPSFWVVDFKTTNGDVHFLKRERQKTPQMPSKWVQCAEKIPRGLASGVMAGGLLEHCLPFLLEKCRSAPRSWRFLPGRLQCMGSMSSPLPAVLPHSTHSTFLLQRKPCWRWWPFLRSFRCIIYHLFPACQPCLYW